MKKLIGCTVIGLGLVLAATGGAEAATKAGKNCVVKGGQGTGTTLEMAKFQSYEIIEQVTGNWPVKTDQISAPTYKCEKGGIGFVCHARATVCKKA